MSERDFPKNYCPYPFGHATTTPTGLWKLCCSSAEAEGFKTEYDGKFVFPVATTSLEDYWQSGYMRWVRQKHQNGEPIGECAACKKYEDQGAESYRQRALKELGVLEQATELPVSLDLKLGNLCNASCLFCDPSSSSRILSEWKSIGFDKKTPFKTGLSGDVGPHLFDLDYKWPENPLFWEQIKSCSQNLKSIKFTGGEPLINPYMIEYLQFLVDQDLAKNIRFQTTSNGIKVPPKFLEIVSRFKEVEINFSVDGFGKQNEYIRFPTKWNSWLKNIERVEATVSKNVALYFQHSISVYSVFGLREYFEWMWPKKRFGFHLFKVFHPEIQQTELLTSAEKNEVVNDLDELHGSLGRRVECERDEQLLAEILGIRNFIFEQEDKSHFKPVLKKYIIELDRHRRISILDYMPRAAECLGIDIDSYKS